MKYHYCVICWADVRHPQQTTCGGGECREAWKNMNTEARNRRKLMATVSPAERNILLLEEEEARNIARTQRVQEAQEALAEYQEKQQDHTPDFIRQMMNPERLKPKEKEEDGNPQPTNGTNTDPTGS